MTSNDSYSFPVSAGCVNKMVMCQCCVYSLLHDPQVACSSWNKKSEYVFHCWCYWVFIAGLCLTKWLSLQAGGCAGMCVDLTLFPLDTIKTRLQSQQGFYKAGGFRGIYAGVPSAAVGSFPNGTTLIVMAGYMTWRLIVVCNWCSHQTTNIFLCRVIQRPNLVLCWS